MVYSTNLLWDYNLDVGSDKEDEGIEEVHTNYINFRSKGAPSTSKSK